MLSETDQYIFKIFIYLIDENADNSFKTLDQIAADTSVPRGYLGDIIQKLAKDNVIETRRGQGGGVRLDVDPSTVSTNEFFDYLGLFNHKNKIGGENCCVPANFKVCVLDEMRELFEEKYRDISVEEFISSLK